MNRAERVYGRTQEPGMFFFFILPSVFEEGGYFLHTGWREKSLKQQKR